MTTCVSLHVQHVKNVMNRKLQTHDVVLCDDVINHIFTYLRVLKQKDIAIKYYNMNIIECLDFAIGIADKAIKYGGKYLRIYHQYEAERVNYEQLLDCVLKINTF